MNRVNKFRFWDPYAKRMTKSYTLYEIKSAHEVCAQCFDHAMQYTGIKDKEGVEIYEKDIAIDKDGLHFTVGIGGYFSKEFAGNGVHYYQIGEKDYWAIEANSFNKETNFKVIGNIYENPELLEADK